LEDIVSDYSIPINNYDYHSNGINLDSLSKILPALEKFLASQASPIASTPEFSSSAFSRPNTPKPINELRLDKIDEYRTPSKISELKALNSSIVKTFSPINGLLFKVYKKLLT
jgi:hypothetical protein